MKIDTLFISDLDSYESLEDAYLRDLSKKARDLGLEIYAGSWSICPTSKVFRNKWGTAEEHLALGIRVAKALGSPVFRCVLGNGQDRLTEGGIEAPRPMYRMMAMEARAPVPIAAGEESITANVTIVWEIR